MLTLNNKPQKQLQGYAPRPAESKPSDIWEGELAIGRAKVYLIGNSMEVSQQIGVANANLQVWQKELLQNHMRAKSTHAETCIILTLLSQFGGYTQYADPYALSLSLTC